MAVRSESVRLSLEDDFTSGMARAAAATALFKKELDGLDGKRVETEMDRTGAGIEGVGDSSRRSGPDIDKLSGRLRLLTDAAVTLGPALVPLGAATIPVLSGALVGLGAAAGGIGAAVLAFSGLGDALDTINDYELEPTADNLQAMRIELEKMGPAGAHFAKYINDLGPQMRELQNVARSGMFPGIEDGINDLLTRLPDVTKIVNRLSHSMGDLAADAGEALAGDDWDAFFRYMKTDAAPTLEAFGRSLGNVALGLSNMLVAFAPVTRDFTTGLEDMTKRFAEWSAGLEDNDAFQGLVDYIRESGPQAVEFLGAIAQAIGGLLQAAAPLGSVVLPALTAVVKVFAAIASSDAGPALYAVAAGLIAFNRAAAVADKYGPRLKTTFASLASARGAAGGIGLLALSLTDLDEKAGLANTSMGAMAGLMLGGPWGLAIGGGIGLTTDLAAANNDLETAVSNANRAMESNSFSEMKTRYQELSEQIEKTKKDSDIDWFGDPYTLGETVDALGATWSNLSGGADDAASSQARLKAQMDGARSAANILAPTIGLTAEELYDAAGAAEDFSGALAELNGWLDKRAALRGYRDGLKDLSKGLKDGFGRKDVENIDAVGESIAQMASLIKDRGLRADFLAGARKSLADMANGAGPKARAEIEELIGALDRYGLTKPPTPKLDADDKPARGKVKNLKDFFQTLVGRPYKSSLTADGSQAISEANRVRTAINAIDAYKSITISVNKVLGSLTDGESADGGTVHGRRYPYADKMLYAVAPGEEIVSNRYGQADRNRSLLKAINAGRFGADGRTAGDLIRNTYVSRGDSDPDKGKGGKDRDQDKMRHTVTLFLEGMTGATHGFKALQKVLKAEEEQRKKAFDRAQSALDEAVGRRDAVAGSISSGLAGDIWADREASDNPWMAGATAGGKATPASALAALREQRDRTQRFLVALNMLKQKGITGPVLAEIIGTGDVERAEMMAALPIEELTSFASVYTAAQSELAAAGLAGGNALEGQNIKVLEKELRGARQELREIRQAINNSAAKHEQAVDKAADKTGDKVKDGVNGAGTKGRRNKVYAK